MYAGVPTVVPVAVKYWPGAALLYAFAIPKSAIFTPPSPVIMMFSGLRSRWTIPRFAACVRPDSSPSSTPTICASLSSRTSGRSEPRGRYSIEMYGTPSCSK
jgi:hypothetical protein